MSEFFEYSSTPSNANMPGPLWPDFNSASEAAQKMINAKQVNDDSFWTKMREVFAHDYETLPLERFKVWASVMTVPFMSNSKHSQYIRLALDAINQSNLYAEALLEPMVGLTERDFNQFYNMFSDYPTTMNRIQCLGHLLTCRFYHTFLKSANSIVELGAGVGDLADIINKLGFEGQYQIYDFPEIGRIQKWYHDQLGHLNIEHTDQFENLSEDPDLVIATWSLTEMPFDLRNQIVDKLKGAKNWLIAYSKEIFGYDNQKWIEEEFLPLFPDHDIEFVDVPFMAWDGGTRYLILRTKSS